MQSSGLVVLSRFSQLNGRGWSVIGLRTGGRYHLTTSSTQTQGEGKKSYKVVVVGGGSGGLTIINKLVKHCGAGNIAVIEPSKLHYYQPLYTLVGGGLKHIDEVTKPFEDVLKKGCTWIQETVAEFNPSSNSVTTDKGSEIRYDILIISTGIVANFHDIKGLPEAFEMKGVCSNFSHVFVNKTYPSITELKEGRAIFTHPATPIKCGGAPQKIMYLAESKWRQNKVRKNIDIKFITGQGTMFPVKKYSDALLKIAHSKDIETTFTTKLIEVKMDTSEAVFESVNSESVPKETMTHKFDFLHVVPPMSVPPVLKGTDLIDESGFVSVNKETLQHVKYPNIFGIGDCLNLPTSKTAAAIASQSGALSRNLKSVLSGQPMTAVYDGYTACPITTDYGKLLLAEFDYNAIPLESFPFDQSKERRLLWFFKKDLMAPLYWYGLLKGFWEGPKLMRKILNPFPQNNHN